MQDLPHPADTNWVVRSVLVYDIKSRNHPKRLIDEQQLGQQNEPLIHKPDTSESRTGPSGQLYQRTGDQKLQRYRKIIACVKSTSNHTINLDNCVVLRKSAVASSKKPAKKVHENLAQPPTPQIVKQKELTKKKNKKDATKSTSPRTLKKPTTSHRLQPISESEGEIVPLSISKRGSSSHTFMPVSEGELH